MKSVMSQIVIGIIVTVVGTVVADAILQGGKIDNRRERKALPDRRNNGRRHRRRGGGEPGC